MPFPSDRTNRRRIRFERNAACVVFDAASSTFVVTWEKCSRPDRERLAGMQDPLKWIPSVLAVATLYDRGCVQPEQTVYAAKAIGRAWSAGDREMLDTESAKKAAELVHDLATMCVDASRPSVARDVGQAMRRLLDEIAAVRFGNLRREDLDPDRVLPVLDRATAECFALPNFVTWSNYSMRKKFLYGLKRQDRTELVYSLVALLFDIGSCPILTLSDRRALRLKAIQASGLAEPLAENAVHAFFQFALEQLLATKADGRTTLGTALTPQQLADSLSGASHA